MAHDDDLTAVTVEDRAPRRRGDTGALAPGDVIGRYVIQRQLGRGGMGVVYRARDPELGRDIAIKLVRVRTRGGSPGVARERLLREAQALAQLAHPNVIAVFDVGTHGDDVFIAMELVVGGSLRTWIKAGPHPWRATVDVMLAAGAGLAAAHAAGLVHRDLKPDNVMIGDDGRVRVLDFGLVRGTHGTDSQPTGPIGFGSAGDDVTTEDAPATVELRPDRLASGERLGAPLTMAGHVVGTPGYMAPEHHRGIASDALSDQYGFCVTLWEALYGRRPFVRDTHDELRDAKEVGKVDPMPRGIRVPGAVRRVVLRGLSPRPGDRFPSMDALLAELARAARPRWRPLALAGAAAVAVTAATIGVLAFARPAGGAPRCDDAAAAHLRGVWDPVIAERVTYAFVATGRPHGAATAGRVVRALDDATAAWRAMRADSCAATERGDQSSELLDLRTACLDHRLEELATLARVFADAPDGEVVDHAVEAVLALAPLDACADAEGLRAVVPLPDSPDVRVRIATLRGQLADAAALEVTTRYADARAIAERVIAEARAIAYPPLLAEALAQLGSLEESLGEADAAAATLREASREAATAHADFLAASTLIDLLWVVGHRQAHFDDAIAMQPAVEAAVARAGNPAKLRSVLLSRLGVILGEQGDGDEAVATLRSALALKEEALGPDHPSNGAVLNNLGEILRDLGRTDEAQATFTRALTLTERALGPEHPDVAAILNNLGATLMAQGKLAESRPYLERSLAIDERTFGPDSARVADSLLNLGSLANLENHPAEGRPMLERALAIMRRVLGPDHPEVAMTMHNLGGIAFAAGDLDGALGYFRGALAIFEKVLGDHHPHLAFPLVGIGDVLDRQGKPADALPYLRRAVAIADPANPDAAFGLTSEGRCLLHLRRPADAVEPLERALALRTASEVSADERARTRFLLAQALWESGRDRRRAVQLARQTSAEIAGSTAVDPGDRAALARWLAAHAR